MVQVAPSGDISVPRIEAASSRRCRVKSNTAANGPNGQPSLSAARQMAAQFGIVKPDFNSRTGNDTRLARYEIER
ncbi:MAG: hypothetical protein ACP5M5_10735 [Acidibrevibacterium sp.]|uniref:hypothetical protein n=1 Tax=Acidibrevibacterium sp. TaxID=2606776 RepID=UPI003D07F00C